MLLAKTEPKNKCLLLKAKEDRAMLVTRNAEQNTSWLVTKFQISFTSILEAICESAVVLFFIVLYYVYKIV